MALLGDATFLFGQGLDRFELIGRGGASTVYRAVDEELGRTVAVKVLHTPFLTEEIPAEALAQGKLSWHSNVLTLYSSRRSPDGSAVLILEHAPGGSLDDRIRRSGPLGRDEWFRLGRELAGALAAAHEAGVIHCDIKPSNVLFAADGSARLADFGIARTMGLTLDTLDPVAASLQFAPPELFEGTRPDATNDVYSLALTMCFAATGKLPFANADRSTAALIASIQSHRLDNDYLEHVPDEMQGLLRQAIEGAPDERPRAKELLEALASGSGTPVAPPPSAPAGHRNFGALAVLIVLVLALIGTVLAVAKMDGRATDPSPASKDICSEFERYVGQRNELIEEVSADLELANRPAEVISRLLVAYPQEFSSITVPFIEAAAATGAVSGEYTGRQLAALVTAENIRGISGGKRFLFDGESGTFDAAALPTDLRESAMVFSQANAFAVERCPDVEVDLLAAKARLYSAMVSNLTDQYFMAEFFNDPTSHLQFDAETVILMAQMGWDFIMGLLEGHEDWLLQLFESNEEIRRSVALEFPEMYLEGAQVLPDQFLRTEWLGDLRLGISRATQGAREGMRLMYPDVWPRLEEP